MIRIIGDPILQQAAQPFPNSPTLAEEQELQKQMQIAKEALIKTGGAGIAANQCQDIERPFRLIIVGIFYEISEHVNKVKTRYPNADFPKALFIVNPEITKISQATQHFNHACLSVPCGNRCAVESPMEISIRFLDPIENMQAKQMSYEGRDAVVLWHELMHILEGKTYMDVTFEALSIKEVQLFRQMICDELERRRKTIPAHLPNLSVPSFYFSVQFDKKTALPRLDKKELSQALENMNEETLMGLLKQASSAIKDRLNKD